MGERVICPPGQTLYFGERVDEDHYGYRQATENIDRYDAMCSLCDFTPSRHPVVRRGHLCVGAFVGGL